MLALALCLCFFVGCKKAKPSESSSDSGGTSISASDSIESQEYVLSFSSEDASKGTVSGTVDNGSSVVVETDVTVTATANEGYTFDGWYNGETKVSSDAEYAFSMPSSNLTLTAEFSVNSYTLTYFSENETKGTAIGAIESGSSVEYSADVALTATANEGYTFEGWYNGETKVSSDAEYTFSMPSSNLTLTAEFSINSYTLTYITESETKGTAIGAIESGSSVEYSAAVTLTATASEGYKFDGWYNGETKVSSDAEYTFSMPSGNLTLTAEFSVNSYTLTYFSENETKGTAIGAIESGSSVEYSADVILTATAKNEYEFWGWYNGETQVSSDAEYTLSMPSSNYSLSAKFVIETPTEYEQKWDISAEQDQSINAYLVGSSSYKLIIIGEGNMLDFSSPSFAPWYSTYNSNIVSCVIDGIVTSIGKGAFYKCSGLTSIEISTEVTSIGDSAFSDCSGLTSIEIPAGVTSIGASAFYYCSGLTSVSFEDNSELASIGDSAFYYCSVLSSIEIPAGVKSIGYSAFCGCRGLTSIEIPAGVTSIDGSAFSGCSGLTSFLFEENSVLTSIGEYTFNRCSGLTLIEIPAGVTSIGANAFYDCSGLTSIEIPATVTSIGTYPLYNCSGLASITVGEGNTIYKAEGNCLIIISTNELIAGCKNSVIPSYVVSIGAYAFCGCSGLTSIELSAGVTSIGEKAFSGCSGLASITVAEENTKYRAEGNCLIERSTNELMFGCKNSVIPNSVVSIGEKAFYECSGLTSIVIPASVTSIGDWAFAYCSGLTSVSFDNNSGLTSISSYAFYKCSVLASIVIPASVTSIGDGAFMYCNGLTSVSFENNSRLTSIGFQSFEYCSGLTSIVIPANVTSIGKVAFLFCSKLTSITFDDTSTWYVTTDRKNWLNKTNGTEIDASTPSTNATYFKSMTDSSYYWYKID